ncbi:MAG: SpoIIE family protein phosphatase [Ignavibacteria bacterium]|jgi:serine phosphatase RsbU (regulator of sigma subunit)
MSLPFSNVKRSRKLENTIFASIILFVYQMVFADRDSVLVILLNDALVFITGYFCYLYLSEFVNMKINSPLTIILNTGILNAILFFLIAISSTLIVGSQFQVLKSNFIFLIISILFLFVFISLTTYIFSTFRGLTFLRQKTESGKYFNTLVTFLIITSFSKTLVLLDSDLDFINNTFFVVSILLIAVNSIKVSWIAFLVKKQKIYLLIIAIVLSVLFGLNYALSLDDSIIMTALNHFSPAFATFISLVMIYGAIYFGVIFFTALFHLPTAEAFDRKAEEVSSLMDLTKLITRVFDFKELAETITTITTKVCNSDSAWLVTKNNGKFELNSVFNIGYVEADKITNHILTKFDYKIEEVLTLDNSSIKIEIKNDIRTFNFKSLGVAPLSVHNKTNGFLFVARKKEMSFDDEDYKAIGAFGDYAAVALENALLIEENIEKERLEKELDVAREVQKKILPRVTPQFENLNIESLFIPAFEVGGDYYDFFELPGDRLGFVIADVSGKGIQAAFIMAEVKGIFESLSKLIESPKQLLIKANEILKKSLEKKSFVTAVYGVVNLKTGIVNFSRVGHNSVMVCRKSTVEHLTPPGIGLGLDYGNKFINNLKELEIKLNNNDIFILYTDGIPESQNANHEEFGYKRFEKVITKNCNKELNVLSNEIIKEVTVFSKNCPQHDDITLVLFKWKLNNKISGDN